MWNMTVFFMLYLFMARTYPGITKMSKASGSLISRHQNLGEWAETVSEQRGAFSLHPLTVILPILLLQGDDNQQLK